MKRMTKPMKIVILYSGTWHTNPTLPIKELTSQDTMSSISFEIFRDKIEQAELFLSDDGMTSKWKTKIMQIVSAKIRSLQRNFSFLHLHSIK